MGNLKDQFLHNNKINIYPGQHDSSCCYYYHKKQFKKKFILISTGTWIIVYNENTLIDEKKIKFDVHLSKTIDNNTVSVARYPGGHELNLLNRNFKKKLKFNPNIFKKILINRDMIIPGFYKGGPFRNKKGRKIIKNKNYKNSKIYNYHLNLIYIACSTFYSLSLLGNKKLPIILDGVFMNNKIFVETISNLSNNKVYLSSDDNGVARGGFLIMNNKNSFQNNYHEYKNKIDFRKMLKQYYNIWKNNLPIN